jgi:choline monooxygenase
MRFDIDADVARAETLPGWAYVASEVYAAEKARVFEASWQRVADAGDLEGLAAYPTLLGDEPIVLTRDAAGTVRALSNVCTHRGALVCSTALEPGGPLRCPYHGRRFALDGRMESMPEFEGAHGFPRKSDDLPSLGVATFADMWFASLAPAAPFAELTRELRARCGFLPLERARLDRSRSADYLVRANWKLYCDNFLEGFHLPYVHAGLTKSIDYGRYRTELYRWSSVQIGPARDDETAFDLPASHPDRGQRVAAYWWWLWPTTMVNVYPFGLSINVVRPLAVDRTRVTFLAYLWDPAAYDAGLGATLHRVEREDEAVVESVQLGVGSRLYQRGRYSPTREQGVHHFHRLYAAAINDRAAR